MKGLKIHTNSDSVKQHVKIYQYKKLIKINLLCFYYINSILEKVRQELNKGMFFTTITHRELVLQSQLEELNAMEAVK